MSTELSGTRQTQTPKSRGKPKKKAEKRKRTTSLLLSVIATRAYNATRRKSILKYCRIRPGNYHTPKRNRFKRVQSQRFHNFHCNKIFKKTTQTQTPRHTHVPTAKAFRMDRLVLTSSGNLGSRHMVSEKSAKQASWSTRMRMHSRLFMLDSVQVHRTESTTAA